MAVLAARVTVPPAAAGERLDRFVARLPGVGSRAEAERLLVAGLVTVDGDLRPKSYRLERGQAVEVSAGVAEQRSEAPVPEPGVAYADEHLVVVDKPAGVVVHPGAGRPGGTLVDALGRLGAVGGEDPERPGIVHRLDRDTSGLMVVARSEEAHRRLRRLVRRRKVERGYLALVRGRPRSRTGRIEAPIGRDRTDPTRQSLETDTPRDAVTHFEVVELLERHALLAVRLETGRMHQIRVHLAAIGLPVVGDRVYGISEPDLGRQFLHAARLAFEHPFTGEQLALESPLPRDLAETLKRARR